MRLSRFLILQIILKVSAKECNRLEYKCCYNEHFDNNTNECVVCKTGSIGWNCKASCTQGYYGHLCQTPCECVAEQCDKQTGCQSPQNKTSAITNNHTLTTLSTIVFGETASQEEYIVTTQAPNKPTFSKSNVQETTSPDVYIETSDQKWNNNDTSVPSYTSSEGRPDDPMSSAVLFFIGSITTVFIGGAFICFRKRFAGVFINRYRGRTQPISSTPPTDRDSGYDEIRYSQLISTSNICADVRATSIANRMSGYSSKSQYVLSVIYDNYNDDDEDYSRLLLKKNQSTWTPKRNVLLEDEGYAFLRASDIKELKSEIVIPKHRSLPSFTTIENSISTEVKPLTRYLSENNIYSLP